MLDKLEAIDSRLQFQHEVLQADKPSLAMFYALWCPHCRSLAPIMNRLAEEYKDDVKFVKVDIDDRPELSEQFGVEAVPTVILFQYGQMVEQWLGEQHERTFADALDALLAGQR